MNKESLIGLIIIFLAVVIISALTGTYGIIYIGLLVFFALISIKLFIKKSPLSKISAVIINNDILYKLLMPNNYKQEINNLKEKENEKRN